jgi:hypothetical protein
MKIFFLQVALLVFGINAVRADSLWGIMLLESFEECDIQTLPKKWRAGRSTAAKIYRVVSENDNRFLRAHADKQGVHLGLAHLFEPKKQQHLRWRWRVHAFPDGADERNAERHDAAAQVYVIFDNSYLPRVIKYIWSYSLPAGARFINPLYGRGWVAVLRSGAAGQGQWHEENVNFYRDYRELFREEPGNGRGIGILTSSDSTQSLAVADYDDFMLLP